MKRKIPFIAGRSREVTPVELPGDGSDLQQFTHRLKDLFRVTNELAMSDTVDDLCRRAIELGRESLGFDRLAIWFRAENDNKVRGSFGTDEKGQLRDEHDCEVSLDSNAYLKELLAQNASAAIIREGPLRNNKNKVVGKGTWACAAMWDGQQAIGYLMMDNLFKGEPVTASHCELLTLFASSLGYLCARLKVEQAFRESKERYKASLNAMSDAIHVVDSDLKVVLINNRFKSWCAELGLEENAIGKDLYQIFPFLSPGVRGEYRTVFGIGEVLATEETLDVDGVEIVTETKKVPIFEGDQVVRVMTIVRDVTAHKQAELALAASQSQLQQAQKMEAVGRLAGGIAHDFNNLLTTILGYGHLLFDRVNPGEPNYKELQEIVHAGERAVELTTQLLSIGRQKQVHVRPVNINTVVMETDRLLRRTLGEDVELVTIPGENLEGVQLEPGKLQQILMNLAINARDAMEGGGKLTVQTAKVRLDESYCRTRMQIIPGDYVRLAVTDTGSGIPEDVRAHMFEPFYTTKDAGKGSGLGLSMVYAIVSQAGGWIDVESGEGKGTEFRIYFPCQEEMTAEVLPSLEKVSLPQGHERVLVVEDEQSVRQFTVKILKTLGYDVLEAGNGEEALAMFEKHLGTIDMVLTDIVMPLMSGKELVDRLRSQEAPLKVLFMSGFSEEALTDANAESVLLMQKPFTCETLARLMREVLDKKS